MAVGGFKIPTTTLEKSAKRKKKHSKPDYLEFKKESKRLTREEIFSELNLSCCYFSI